MTFAEVQHKYGTEVSATSITTTYTATPIAGSVLVAMGSAVASSTLAISGWTSLTAVGTGPVAQIFWKRAAGTEGAIQMTSTASTNLNLDIFEFSGFAVPFAPIEMTGATGTAVSSLASNNLVTVRASSMTLYALALSNNAGSAFAFTNSVTGGDTANGKMSGGYRLNVAAGTYTTTASWTTARNAAMAGVVFISSGAVLPTGDACAVELGLGSTWKTADTAIVWTDITSYVRQEQEINTSRGRNSLQEDFKTSTIDLELNNQDRIFDTLYSAGAFYGQLKPGVPIRVVEAPAGQSMRHLGRGTVSGFPQRYDVGNTMAYVPISGNGIFDKLARAKLPQSAVDVEVLADSPVAYWKLDDTTEAEMLDSSGNDRHGVYDNPELNQDALVADGGSSVQFAHVGDHRGKANLTTGMPTDFPCTFECWLKVDRDLTQAHVLLNVQRDTAYGSGLTMLIETSAGGSPNGEVVFNFRGLGSFWKRRGSTAVDDGLTHHVVLSMTDASTISLYVDGVAETLTTISGTAGGSWAGHYWWTVGNLLDNKTGDYGTGGILDNVAVYNTALSAARVLVHYQSGTAPWDGDLTDERLDRICDLVGLPADRRNFNTGRSVLGPAVLEQQRALDYMRLVERSEDGRMPELADGRIGFLDRYWGLTDSHATASQQTFSDISGVSYSDLQIDPDDELLVNSCTVTRPDAVAIPPIRNDTSIDTYGEADISIDVLLQTDAECRSLAEHVVLTRGTPAERVSALKVPLHKYTAAQQAAILDLEIGYLITVNRTPQGVGSAMSLSLIIEGIAHRKSSVEHWVTFNVSVAPTATNYWIWGTSTWGSSTRWGW